MIGFAERVIEYTNGLDQTGFEASAMTYDATLRKSHGGRSSPPGTG